MNSSDLLRLFASANRKIGKQKNDENYIRYANALENEAAVSEATETLRQDRKSTELLERGGL